MTNFDKKVFETNKNPDITKPGTSIKFITAGEKFKKRILKNERIFSTDIKELKEELGKTRISVFGQEMTQEELKKISKETIKISKKILSEEDNRNFHETLTHLFPDVFKKLITICENISLPAITSLTQGQFELLAEYSGRLTLGLTSLTDNQAELLSRNVKNLFLDSITSLNDKQAEAFSRNSGALSLGGLTFISPKQIELLAKNRHDMYFDGLTSLNDKQAEAFSKCKGKLSLNDITSLTDYQLELLAKRKGKLSLNGIGFFTDEQVKLLSEHDGDLYLRSFVPRNDEQSVILSKNKGTLKCGYVRLY